LRSRSCAGNSRVPPALTEIKQLARPDRPVEDTRTEKGSAEAGAAGSNAASKNVTVITDALSLIKEKSSL
ncbi:MAG: hypothetical protein LBU86_04920, partial [Oscillospiraceae bacterium]|nr:hypothetical protein [Oscillospiraceae bacterium]